MIWRLIPTRAALWAALLAVGAALVAWLRIDARRSAARKSQIEDYEHADKITGTVDRSRADPERLRPYEDHGWRD